MTAHAATERYRPPAGAFGRLVELQVRMAWREPISLLAGLAVPLFFLVVFGTVPTFDKPFPSDPRFTVSTYLMPLWIALAVCMITLFSMPGRVVRDRENGWLRRVSTTPVPPSWMLGAQTAVDAALALLAVAVLTLGSVALFGMAAPARVGGYILVALLLITAMFALGLLIAAVAPSPGIAIGLANVAFYPLLFFGGIWVARADMAPALRTVSDLTPLMAASRAMRDAMLGTFPAVSSLLVLVGWTVVCGAAAVRFFRWE